MNVRLVTTQAQLRDEVATLEGAPRIALDCESNGMHAYRGRLCVMQLAVADGDAPREVLLVDALAVGDVSPLARALGPEGPPKILHDAGFDARLLRDAGVTLGRVVDTAVFARFLGVRETGLASLLASRFGVALEKSLQQHDWARRPLGARELDYLAGDVRDLGRLADALEAEAVERDILAEVREETDYALRAALADGDERAPYARLKGARELSAASRAVLREVWGVREARAEALDVPPGRVLSNASLVQLAKARPRTAADVLRGGFAQGGAAGLEADLAAASARGLEARDVPADERRWFASERIPGDLGLRRAREALLQHWRAEEAARRGVDLQVVLPGHCLSDLAARGARTTRDLEAVDGFGGVRVARYGAALVELLGTVA